MNPSRMMQLIWYEGRFRGLFYLLLPLSFLFGLVVRLRRGYARFFPSKLKVKPIIVVVGNISVGGTGKTPLVLALIQLLEAKGLKVGVIARGYRSDAEHAIKPVKVTAESTPVEVGDEPCLVAARTGVPFMVHANRVLALQSLLAWHPDLNVVLSDDGLQHLALSRDIELVVVDQNQGFGNGALLPAGPLREPLSRLKDVDFVVKNGEDFWLEATRLLGVCSSSSMQLVSLKGETVHAVAGIGHPERFFAMLTALGAVVVPHAFPDHHSFLASDFDHFQDEWIVMTEKDAVKCKNFSLKRANYLEVKTILSPRFQDAFLKKLTYT